MTSILEFTFTAEQQQLREQAREVAHKGVEKHGRFNDSWINGFSKDSHKPWPKTVGSEWDGPKNTEGKNGHRLTRNRSRRNDRCRGSIAAMWFADRQMGPTVITYGTDDQKQNTCRRCSPEKQHGA